MTTPRPYVGVPLLKLVEWVERGGDPDANRELCTRVRLGEASAAQIDIELAYEAAERERAAGARLEPPSGPYGRYP